MRKSAGGTAQDRELSTMLRDLRKARGLSQGELSRRAGVSDSTLSRWESGKFAPDIPELEAVLAAIGATDSERQGVLRTFHAPRAIRRLREITGAAAPPVGGDLLWAMRLRKGWTQTETARMIGITQAQIARWEKGESWPTDEKLHTLCWHLNAHPAEIAALTSGASLSNEASPPPDREAWLSYLNGLMHENAPPDDLLDASMIGVEARLSHLAVHHAFAAELLPLAYTIHARHHYARHRSRQATHCAERSLALLQRQKPAPVQEGGGAYWMASVIICTFTAVQKRIPSESRRAYRQMRTWLDHTPPSDLYYTWALSETARCLAAIGSRDEAVTVGRAACAGAKKVDYVEQYFRMRQYARLLLDAGLPAEALDLLDEADTLASSNPFNSEYIGVLRLMRAEGLLALGLRHEADELLRPLEHTLSPNRPDLEQQMNQVAAQL